MKKIIYLPFEVAREFVRSLNLENKKEWNKYCQSNKKPDYIPATPYNIYKKEWISLKNWLGTEFLSFIEAKQIIQLLNFKKSTDFIDFMKSNKRIKNIPADPAGCYKKEWLGWGDWLGTNYIAHSKRRYLNFDDARKFVHSLKIKSQKEWSEYCKSENKPNNIPSFPDQTYKKCGWKCIGDWLGYKIGFNVFLPYEEAKTFVHTLGLKNREEWSEYVKSGNKPDNIPANPYSMYRKKSLFSWGYFLGTGTIAPQIISKLKKEEILKYLYSLKDSLTALSVIELYTIISQSKYASEILFTEAFKQIKSTNPFSKEREEAVSNLIKEEECKEEEIEIQISETEISENLNQELISTPILSSTEAISVLDNTTNIIQSLKALDLNDIKSLMDDEAIQFLIKNRINIIWNDVLNNKLNISEFKNEISTGFFFNQIKMLFFNEYDAVLDTKIPKTYISSIIPNLMQKLTVYRINKYNSFGNWSTTGTGKTLASILSTKIEKSKFVVAIAPNSVIENWKEKIDEYFDPNTNNIIVKYDKIVLSENKTNYLLLNYEWFQQPNAENKIFNILKKQHIDFIITDEIHFAKQRNEDVSSRRDKIKKLILNAKENNPNIKILGMSATPVINNLKEAKSLLEIINGIEYDDIDTTLTISNAIKLHQHLILNGLRYRGDNVIPINRIEIEIDGSELIEKLKETSKGDIIKLEQILLDLKLHNIESKLQKGTIIYSYYKEGITNKIVDFCKSKNFKVGVYNGDDKSGLDKFLNKKIDILVATSAISTGVDKLQYVSNRIIALILPWTHAEYEQLVGRICRQGTLFQECEIIIPKVILNNNGDIWSWDISRIDRINFKRDISDCVVDGIMPDEKRFMRPETLLVKSTEALLNWIDRLENGNVISFERKDLTIPLNPKFVESIQRKCGDFSTMNKDWSIKNSKETNERLSKNPEEWYLYHDLYRKIRENWNEIPYKIIAEKIGDETYTIADMGCGENLLKNELKSCTVKSFDHVSIDETVTACDISNLPLGNNCVDFAVLSLALMGSNKLDYILEAFRILKRHGKLYIAEPKNKWDDEEKFKSFINDIESVGFAKVDFEKSEFIYIVCQKTL